MLLVSLYLLDGLFALWERRRVFVLTPICLSWMSTDRWRYAGDKGARGALLLSDGEHPAGLHPAEHGALTEGFIPTHLARRFGRRDMYPSFASLSVEAELLKP